MTFESIKSSIESDLLRDLSINDDLNLLYKQYKIYFFDFE